jgi:hypothetical protein
MEELDRADRQPVLVTKARVQHIKKKVIRSNTRSKHSVN